jgi:hypothetical protein
MAGLCRHDEVDIIDESVVSAAAIIRVRQCVKLSAGWHRSRPVDSNATRQHRILKDQPPPNRLPGPGTGQAWMHSSLLQRRPERIQ